MSDTIRVTIAPDEPIGTISPALHGHFAEHLGELVYPGIWVGPDSPVPNVDGIRTDVVDALRPLRIPVLRWPGGCFADDYNWRDGVGPRQSRPARVNTHWGMAPEPNQFGTHEFVAFARAIGAQPYFAGNLGSGSPRDLRDWIEYCNHPGGSTLADQRRANGADDPFGVRLWGIGNENWGCGGQMTPEAYAEAYARFRTFAFDFGGTPITGIACGPNGSDWDWTRRFFEQLRRGSLGDRTRQVQAFAAHYYCGTAGTATEFDESQWLELLTKAIAVEGIITGHRQLMDEFDPDRRIDLILDEWGAWHPVETGKPRGGLYQQNTMRDALVAALSLDIFHNQADKLVMANIAQLINVLQSVLLVDEQQCITTPTYHVFALYAAHQGRTAVRVQSSADVLSTGEAAEDVACTRFIDRRPAQLRTVAGSASVSGDDLVVTLTNASPSEPVEVEVDVRRVRLADGQLITLAADDIHAHNTFAHPDAVSVADPAAVPAVDGRLRATLPAASVNKLTVRLG